MRLIRFVIESFMSLFLLHQRIYEIKYIVTNEKTSSSTLIATRFKNKAHARNRAIKRLGKQYREQYLKVEEAKLIKEIYLKTWDEF